MQTMILAIAFAAFLAVAALHPGAAQSTTSGRLTELAAANDLARSSYAARDYRAFLRATELGVSLAPGNEYQLLGRARAEARSGLKARAVATLQEIVALGSAPDLTNADLASLRDDPAFIALASSVKTLAGERRGTSTILTTLPDRELITEGVAVDEETGDLYVSGAYRRIVLRIRRTRHGAALGAAEEFVSSKQTDLWGPTGLVVDSAQRRLWVCSSSRPQMAGAKPDEPRRGALLGFELGTGRQVAKYPIANDEPGHSCDSLAVAPDGAVFLSDPVGRAVWQLRAGERALAALIAPGLLPGPQDLAVTPDGKAVYIADYARGVFRKPLPDGDLEWLEAPRNSSVVGIDGLEWDAGGATPRLIAIQNGVSPHRITALALDRSGTRIEKVDVLAQNIDGWDEPTLGVIYQGALLYIGRSQWQFVDAKGGLKKDSLKEPAVFSLPLPRQP